MINFGLMNYCETFGKLPESQLRLGELVLMSWRARIAPFLEKPPFAIDMSHPWNAEQNKRLMEWTQNDNVLWVDSSGQHVYLAAFSSDSSESPWGTLSIFDLPRNYPLVLESRLSITHWAEAGDLILARTSMSGATLRDATGLNEPIMVLFSHGEIRKLDHQMPVSHLRALCRLESTTDLTAATSALNEHTLQKTSTDELSPHLVR